MVLMFIVMAVVLVLRPTACSGARKCAARGGGHCTDLGAALALRERFGGRRDLYRRSRAVHRGDYWLTAGSEILIAILFAGSLQFLISAGGLVSFRPCRFVWARRLWHGARR